MEISLPIIEIDIPENAKILIPESAFLASLNTESTSGDR